MKRGPGDLVICLDCDTVRQKQPLRMKNITNLDAVMIQFACHSVVSCIKK